MNSSINRAYYAATRKVLSAITTSGINIAVYDIPTLHAKLPMLQLQASEKY